MDSVSEEEHYKVEEENPSSVSDKDSGREGNVYVDDLSTEIELFLFRYNKMEEINHDKKEKKVFWDILIVTENIQKLFMSQQATIYRSTMLG